MLFDPLPSLIVEGVNGDSPLCFEVFDGDADAGAGAVGGALLKRMTTRWIISCSTSTPEMADTPMTIPRNPPTSPRHCDN